MSTIREMEVELEQLRKEKRQQEQRLHHILDLLPDMIWMTDRSGFGDYHNKAWLKFTGRTYRESQGQGWLEAIHPDDREMLKEAWESVTTRQTDRWELTYRVRDIKAGIDVYAEVRGFAEAIINGGNEVVGYGGTTVLMSQAEKIIQTKRIYRHG